jgi:CubicO group peptidase (beta-lactamase class C family)
MVRQWITEESFAYESGRGNRYSDLGFMLLEWIVEERTGENLVDIVREHFYQPLGLKRTLFIPAQENPSQSPVAKGGEEEFAATEECPIRKRVLRGEVHDDNAWALGGYSGHAGLFSTCEEIYTIVNMLREHYLGTRFDFFKPETVREFWRRQDYRRERLPDGYASAQGSSAESISPETVWDIRATQARRSGWILKKTSLRFFYRTVCIPPGTTRRSSCSGP